MEKEMRPIAEGREYRHIVNRFIDGLYRQAVCYREAVKSLDSLITGAERDENAPLKAYYAAQKEQYTCDLDLVNGQIANLKSSKKFRDEYVYRLIEDMVSVDKSVFEDDERAHLKRDRKTLVSVLNGETSLTEYELGIIGKYQGAILDTTVARASAKIMCGYTGSSKEKDSKVWLYGNPVLPGNYIPPDAVVRVRGLTETPPQEFCLAVSNALSPENLVGYQRDAREVMKKIREEEVENRKCRQTRCAVADAIEKVKHYVDLGVLGVSAVGFFGFSMLACIAPTNEEWTTFTGLFINNIGASAVYAALSAGTQKVLDELQKRARSPKQKRDYTELENLLIGALNGEDPKANNERGN